MDTELKEYIDKSAAETREYFDVVAGGIKSELKHHFDITAEQMRHDVQLLAEVVGIVNSRMEREFAAVRSEMAQGFKDTHDLIRFAYTDLDRRKR